MTQKKVKIKAQPTKDFFITMLTIDIGLRQAIVDLIDNCVDGAIRMQPKGKYKDLDVQLTVKPELFRISDNCGGISVEKAKEYAFRFGRPKNVSHTPHSIGQFGVGMKRALFKLGSNFVIESTTETDQFKVVVDVNDWKTNDIWEFYFDELNPISSPLEKCGTRITVNSLHESVADDFGLENFIDKLRDEIMDKHHHAIENGLNIVLNGIPLESHPMEFLYSNALKPAYFEETYDLNTSSVNVRIYAGIGKSWPPDSGWYIYCNGRMIMRADQTLATGWGISGENAIPKYHNEFARFRGFAYFTSENAGLLPWNTTKTGVDSDSAIYRVIKQKMVTLMRPVITFLYRLDEEKDRETDDKPLEAAVAKSKPRSVARVRTSRTFSWPKQDLRPKLPKRGLIAYNKPVVQIAKIKKVLKVLTYKAVGEKTFEYFYERECKDNA